MSWGKFCTYPPATTLPLRERRAHEKAVIPGIQQPWSVAVPEANSARSGRVTPIRVPLLLAETSIDPFGVLPIEMPYKSKELLKYCK